MAWFTVAAIIAVSLALLVLRRFRRESLRPGPGMPRQRQAHMEASEELSLRVPAVEPTSTAAPEAEKHQKAKSQPGPAQTCEEEYHLPQRYGRDRLVLMARDPDWIYAYWEVTHEKYQEMYRKHVAEWGLSAPVIRLYDVTRSSGQPDKLDVFINDHADNWYIEVGRPNHRFVAELGRLFPGAGFVPFIRSNEVTMPPRGPSEVFALNWAPVRPWSGYPSLAEISGPSSPFIWRKNP